MILGLFLVLKQYPSPATEQQFPSPNSYSTSLLLVWVDKLQDDSRLEGVWLIHFVPTQKEYILIAIYPPKDSLNDAWYQQLSSLPPTIGDDIVNPALIEMIKEKYYFNANTILVDDFAMVSFINTIGDIHVRGEDLDGIHAIGSMTMPWKDYLRAEESQYQVLNGICTKISDPINNIDPANLVMWLQNNFHFNLSNLDLLKALPLAMSNNDDICEFTQHPPTPIPSAVNDGP